MKIAYLGLGSNLGDRQANLADAVTRLEAPKLRVLRRSSLWETEPRDMVHQPWFLNQVIEAESDLFPMQLLARIRRIENDMGRVKTTPKGPRLIDIDVLFFGRAVVRTGELEIPHPRLAERRFVLEPMAELNPDFRHPITRRTIREMLAAVTGQEVRRL